MLYRQDFVTQFRICADVIVVNTFTALQPSCASLDHGTKEGHNTAMIDLDHRYTGLSTRTDTWPAVRVHHLDHIVMTLTAAAAADCPVHLVSARDGIALHGSAWFRQICQRGAALAPGARWACIVDCSAAPGLALAALAAGVDGLLISEFHPDAARRLCEIASNTHQRVQTTCRALLDLGEKDALLKLGDFFATHAVNGPL